MKRQMLLEFLNSPGDGPVSHEDEIQVQSSIGSATGGKTILRRLSPSPKNFHPLARRKRSRTSGRAVWSGRTFLIGGNNSRISVCVAHQSSTRSTRAL